MKKQLIKLQQLRATKGQAMKALLDIASKAEGNQLTEDQQRDFDQLESDQNDLDAKIENLRRMIDAEVRIAGYQAPNPDVTPEQKVAKRYSITRAMRSLLRGNDKLDGLEREMHDQAVEEARSMGKFVEGIGIPSFMMDNQEARVVEVGGSASNAATIPTTQQALIPALRPNTIMQQLGATMLTGLSGNLDLPVGDAIAQTNWAAEKGAAAETTPTTIKKSLSPKRLAAYTSITKQNIIQSSIAVDTWIVSELSNAVARAVDVAAINGSGIDPVPEGLLLNTDVNVIELGTNGGALSRKKILEMITAIAQENASLGSQAFATTPGVRGFLQDLKVDAGSGNFVWGLNANQLMGYNAGVSTLLPSANTKGTGTNLHTLIFGDWKKLYIGQFGGLDITINPYTEAINGQIQIVTNSFWDVQVPQGQAFSVITDIDLS